MSENNHSKYFCLCYLQCIISQDKSINACWAESLDCQQASHALPMSTALTWSHNCVSRVKVVQISIKLSFSAGPKTCCCCFRTPAEGWGMAENHSTPEARKLSWAWTRGRKEIESCQKASGSMGP